MNTADFAWLADQGSEFFRLYAGKCIAVLNGEVIGVGDTATEAVDQAEKRAPGADYVLEAIDTTADVIYADLPLAAPPN